MERGRGGRRASLVPPPATVVPINVYVIALQIGAKASVLPLMK